MSLNLFFLLVLFLSTWTLDQFRRVCGNSFSSCFLVCPIAADKSEPMKVVRRSIFFGGPCDDIFTGVPHWTEAHTFQVDYSTEWKCRQQASPAESRDDGD